MNSVCNWPSASFNKLVLTGRVSSQTRQRVNKCFEKQIMMDHLKLITF